MHYHRWYRHGDPLVEPGGGSEYVRRYLTASAPAHPLAMKNGKVYVHRATLFDAIGWGPHPCHWCGTELHWRPTSSGTRLDVDHLDGDGSNNHPSNLVPSCSRCNSARGVAGKHERMVAKGYWSHHDTVGDLAPRLTAGRFPATRDTQ